MSDIFSTDLFKYNKNNGVFYGDIEKIVGFNGVRPVDTGDIAFLCLQNPRTKNVVAFQFEYCDEDFREDKGEVWGYFYRSIDKRYPKLRIVIR